MASMINFGYFTLPAAREKVREGYMVHIIDSHGHSDERGNVRHLCYFEPSDDPQLAFYYMMEPHSGQMLFYTERPE